MITFYRVLMINYRQPLFLTQMFHIIERDRRVGNIFRAGGGMHAAPYQLQLQPSPEQDGVPPGRISGIIKIGQEV